MSDITTIGELNAHILNIQKEAVKEWMDKHSDESIKEKVYETLNQNFKETVLKLLGFDNRWGTWEIDRNNKHFIAAQEYISDVIKNSYKEWMDNIVLDEIKRVPKAAIKKAAIKDFRYHLDWELQRAVKTAATDMAETLAQELAGQLNQISHLLKEAQLEQLLLSQER